MSMWASRRRKAAAVRAATIMLALTLPGPPRLSAQDTATFTLTGQIVDAVSETPVLAAVVKVPELRRFVFTDAAGRFAFTDFPEGTWDIIVEQLGYHTLDGSVTVAEGNGLSLRLNPDPIELEGLRVRTRSERLLTERRLRIPYRVTTIAAETFANSVNPDPTAIFRFNSGSQIMPCPETAADVDEQMTPGCFWWRGKPARIAVYLDEGRLESGMTQLTMLPAEHIHSMDWVPAMGELRIYTRHFIERLDNTRISLSPLVY